MVIVVSIIKEADIDGAVDVIQDAFKDDPYARWIYGDARSEADLARNRHSLTLRSKWGMRNALFHVAKDVDEDGIEQVVGVAMWMLPKKAGEKMSWSEWIDDWWLWMQQGYMNLSLGRGGLDVKRYYIWKKNQAQAQNETWTDPNGYYFLNIIVVAPGRQGQGIGKALFNKVTKEADAQGRKCYLESSRDEPNTKIYQAVGFEKVKEMDCDDDGVACRLFCMVREPQGGK